MAEIGDVSVVFWRIGFANLCCNRCLPAPGLASLLARLRGQNPQKPERNWAQKAVPGSEWKLTRGKPSTDIRAGRRAQCPHAQHCGHSEED
jgi:hypothetical protein